MLFACEDSNEFLKNQIKAILRFLWAEFGYRGLFTGN
jgi:hypothetical protein